MSELLQSHPAYHALVGEIALLQEELARLLTEEHDLECIWKPHLLALYQKKIGAWELQRLYAQVAERRARRRLEMAQAALNRGQKPVLAEIDGQLKTEFLTWQQKLQEATDRLTAATKEPEEPLPEATILEIRKLYYALVKRLHPDVNDDLNEEQRCLWLRVQIAYQRRDVHELRALTLLAEGAGETGPEKSSLESLREDGKVLRKQIETVLFRIEQIEKQPPFTVRAQLDDEAWLAQRRQEIEAETAQLEARRAALAAQWQILFPAADDGQFFGLN